MPEITFYKYSKPWTILFSAKSLGEGTDGVWIKCRQADRTYMYIVMRWGSGVLKYKISNDEHAIPNLPIRLDTTKFNHVALECVDNKLVIWINGKSRKMHDVDLGFIYEMKPGNEQLGIFNVYDRNLSKSEIAEHFVEYHVKNFTTDEVLN